MTDRHKPKACFADQAAATQAVEMVIPLMLQGMQQEKTGDSGFLYIVMMDPSSNSAIDDFESSILYEHALGDPDKWDADYASFARSKARISWRTGRDGHSVRVGSPHLLRDDDSGIWGSVCIEGIVVGVSGGFPWYDEAIAACVAHCFKAIVKERALAEPEAPFLLSGTEQHNASDKRHRL
ncbi:hypothetical protein EKL30_04125 [Candidimonas sp. SYP-B2681]|uniref:hypothetical protein n=1 Tax=Candidimonas sp. SYP-B2681 TaxID=2497686 RepID=UPI000F869736|nr:hypothetical protein [Candidimonas sp. SYP-B2681]RTZ48315.1 hypothetical protein EKL30_04125 [Candidimonas sp. SYP-B2681]